MSVRITCINKSGGFHQDPHHAISHLGWLNEQTGEKGKATRLTMYDFLKNKKGEAYVKDAWGNIATVVPRETATGTKYVQTIANQTWTDNLLSLVECL